MGCDCIVGWAVHEVYKKCIAFICKGRVDQEDFSEAQNPLVLHTLLHCMPDASPSAPAEFLISFLSISSFDNIHQVHIKCSNVWTRLLPCLVTGWSVKIS